MHLKLETLCISTPCSPPLLSPSLAPICPSVDVGNIGVDGVWWWLARSSRHVTSRASDLFLLQFTSEICNKTFVSTKKYEERKKFYLLGPKRRRLASFGPVLPFQLSPFCINHRYSLYIQQNFSQYLYHERRKKNTHLRPKQCQARHLGQFLSFCIFQPSPIRIHCRYKLYIK